MAAVPDTICECSFKVGAKKICSPPEVVEQFNKVLQDKGVIDKPVAGDVALDEVKKITGCDSEVCALKHSMISPYIVNTNKIIQERFKPEGPATGTALLNNFNIDDVMTQLAAKYNGADNKFMHIPFQMRDFKKYSRGLSDGNYPSQINLANVDFIHCISDGYKYTGCVCNTDYSTGGGIHWFAIFCDFRSKPYTIEYFNSSGNLPLKEIQEWMIETRDAIEDALDVEVNDVVVSRIVHQTDQHSCGVYALYYIYSRLAGVPYTYFANNRVPDEDMHKFRKVFFRPENQ